MALNYPKEKISSIKNVDYSKGKLGMGFEELINCANNYYLQNNIAAIYKKPTPIQVVKVSYESRNKAKITEAYYKTPSTTDYNGIYKGKYIDFEAKSCSTNYFPFERLYVHQIEHLRRVKRLGGIAFLILEFTSLKETFIIPSSSLLKLYDDSLNGGRKSINYEIASSVGFKVNLKNNILDYLSTLDIFM